MFRPLQIWSPPEELDQGLFGQTFYHLLQILPYLMAERIFPSWNLKTLHYGDPPDQRTIPGVLDLAYDPPKGPYRVLSLAEMCRRHSHVLGNDWAELNRMWNRYFRVPDRVLLKADAILPRSRVLGVHYRGTDKQTASWDSNPISQEQYIVLLQDFLRQSARFDLIFVATDESSFVDKVRRSFDLPIVSMGAVEFHMAATHSTTRAEKADRAMLDCVLLSRCACVVETSSALPSFAKLLNPGLEIYRCAASKLFGKLYTDMPYFPVAHIPVLPVTQAQSRQILDQTMQMDWTEEPATVQYRKPFVAKPRWPRNHNLFSKVEKLGVDRLVGALVSGYK